MITSQQNTTLSYLDKITKIQNKLHQFIEFENYKASVGLQNRQVSEKRISLLLDWIDKYIDYIKAENTFSQFGEIYDLKRGDVVLIDLGFNIGKEFGGEHPAIVLRDSRKGIDQVMVLPISSKKPKNLTDPIYVEIPFIKNLKGYQNPNDPNDPDNGKHWANILSIKNLSKSRIIYPPEKSTVDGRYLNRISAAIKKQIALRWFTIRKMFNKI